MKILFVLILIATTLFAEYRPKIALVLSGGGARGGAHAGVLKVLEEKKIPIDMIVGTSMGSFVGGLYASGRTPQEIEQMLVTSPWREYIRTDFKRADIPMRKKEIEYDYQGRLGLGIDTQNNIVLPTGVLKRQPLLFKFMQETEDSVNVRDFDKLPIPFCAVATNIQNGDKVVIKSGSLAKAIYASSSIPGGLQPIRINGLDLVDGGVSDNMPIAVARDMGADIIIAVDVSENFSKNLKVDSYFVVMGQLVNILMRKNANDSISTLGIDDVLITPDLNGFTGLDADKYKAIIEKGVEATKKAYSGNLQELSLSDEAYEKYKSKYRKKLTSKTIIIDEIQIDNPTYISDDSIRKRLSVKVGDELDPQKLREELLHIYNMMIFDSIEYSIVKQDSKNILVITSTPSWDNHGEIRFALGIEDDFEGHSAYSLKAGYTMFGMNEYGGEWKTDFQIGRTKLAQTEFFQPFDAMQRYYIKPSLMYKERLDLVPEYAFGHDGKSNVELELARYGGSLALGAHITTDYEIEVGISNYQDKLNIELFKENEEYNAVPIYVSFRADSLDNLNFPNSGYKSKVAFTKEMHNFGSNYDYEQVYADFEFPLSVGSHNFTTYVKYGDTFNDSGPKALVDSFRLGGLFNLSGYAPYSLNDDNMVFGILKYRYEIKDGGFFGALNSPLYAGISLESGDTWSNDESFTYEELKKSATLYVAADTFLGPFYLAYGASDDGEQSVYLYLGEKF